MARASFTRNDRAAPQQRGDIDIGRSPFGLHACSPGRGCGSCTRSASCMLTVLNSCASVSWQTEPLARAPRALLCNSHLPAPALPATHRQVAQCMMVHGLFVLMHKSLYIRVLFPPPQGGIAAAAATHSKACSCGCLAVAAFCRALDVSRVLGCELDPTFCRSHAGLSMLRTSPHPKQGGLALLPGWLS